MKVAVIGIGGVGSWCAEALLRGGFRNLLLVDDDVVVESNLNRQCEATRRTIGMPKVVAMRERLLEIDPAASIETRCERFTSSEQLKIFAADVVVDAIDSVDCKAELILAASEAGIPIVSSMGAALRIDPTKVALRRFDRIEGDALARALRHRFRRLGCFPKRKFLCAVSDEPSAKSDVRWTRMTVTAAFGLCLAYAVFSMATTVPVEHFTNTQTHNINKEEES